MARARKRKTDHLIPTDVVDSRSKAGVWFEAQARFKAKQKRVMDAFKETADWIPLKDAVLAISSDLPGIAVIAPNPSLPGIIVLADSSSKSNTEKLQKRFAKQIQTIVNADEKSRPPAKKSTRKA